MDFVLMVYGFYDILKKIEFLFHRLNIVKFGEFPSHTKGQWLSIY